jgi:hypothetical protein
LANDEQHTGAQGRPRYLASVRQMQEQKAEMEPLAEATRHFTWLLWKLNFSHEAYC